MVLYTAGIQLLTRIYNVLLIEGEKSKSEFCLKKQIPQIYIFLKFWLNLLC